MNTKLEDDYRYSRSIKEHKKVKNENSSSILKCAPTNINTHSNSLFEWRGLQLDTSLISQFKIKISDWLIQEKTLRLIDRCK